MVEDNNRNDDGSEVSDIDEAVEVPKKDSKKGFAQRVSQQQTRHEDGGVSESLSMK